MATALQTLITDEQRHQFHENGYCVLRGFLAPEEVNLIRGTFMAQGADGPLERLSDSGRLSPDEPLARWPRMMHPHRHLDLPVGPLALRYMLDERIHAVLLDLLGEEPLSAQSMFYFKPPGARGQDFHQDNFYLRVQPGTCYAAWIAIDDADQDNGCMSVVPGSNRIGIQCPEQSDSSLFFTTEHVPIPSGLHAEPVILAAGDILFFNGSVIHGSYPNTSPDRFRCAFICHYVPASSAEVSGGYRPLLTFDGTEVPIEPATGGGPCGTVQAPSAPH